MSNSVRKGVSVVKVGHKKYRIIWPRLITAIAILVALCILLGFGIHHVFSSSVRTNASSELNKRSLDFVCSTAETTAKQAIHTQAVARLYNSNVPMVRTANAEVGNKGGKKYWKWCGFSYPVAWCGCFISWCADKNGYIKSKQLQEFYYVPNGVNWFKTKKRWKNAKYIPQAGDIIFFQKDNDGIGDHVGIVAGCYDGRVYTIEGNRKDKCIRANYSLKSDQILGYGIYKK